MNTSTLNLSITLRPSKILAATIVSLHLLAAVCIALISIPLWVKVIVVLIIITMAKTSLSQYVWLNAENSIIKINSTSSVGQFLIQTKGNKFYQASMINSVWLFEYLALIVFQVKVNNRKTKTIKAIITKDMISQEQLYVLRLTFQNFAAGQ